MQATINGKSRNLSAGCSLARLVETLGLDIRKVAVELNLTIVPRSLYGETMVHEGDHIEIVQFIGGG